jgi:protoporphyrinogen oxidase
MIKVQKKVIVIGGGLSGLTAANEILKKIPDMHVTVLEANDYLGGRTKSI